MKLFLCNHCGDMQKLRYTIRTCDCGATSGAYEADGVNAWLKGPCTSIAIGNGSLQDALARLPRLPADRAFYPIMAWVRPNFGPTNPHTTHAP
jgi:hypothetical protein